MIQTSETPCWFFDPIKLPSRKPPVTLRRLDLPVFTRPPDLLQTFNDVEADIDLIRVFR
jgi:hypothetical protein